MAVTTGSPNVADKSLAQGRSQRGPKKTLKPVPRDNMMPRKLYWRGADLHKKVGGGAVGRCGRRGNRNFCS